MKIGQQIYRLSLGARIYAQSNRAIMPGAVRAKTPTALIANLSGELFRAWVLSLNETKELKQLREDRLKSLNQL